MCVMKCIFTSLECVIPFEMLIYMGKRRRRFVCRRAIAMKIRKCEHNCENIQAQSLKMHASAKKRQPHQTPAVVSSDSAAIML